MALPPVPAAPTLSQATSGDGTKFYVDVGAGWVPIGELDDEDGLPELPGGDHSMYETTHMGSGKYKEHKVNNRVDGREVELTGNYVIGASETLDAINGRQAAYMVELKQGAITAYETGWALFHSMSRSNPGAAVRKFTITAKWISEPTVTIEGDD